MLARFPKAGTAASFLGFLDRTRAHRDLRSEPDVFGYTPLLPSAAQLAAAAIPRVRLSLPMSLFRCVLAGALAFAVACDGEIRDQRSPADGSVEDSGAGGGVDDGGL